MRRAALLCGAAAVASGCTNMLVTKGASAEGTPHIAYAADNEARYGHLPYYPAATFAPGQMEKIYDWDSLELNGEIPYPPSRYNVVGNMNEHGLAIGETTFGGLESLSSQPGAILDYGSLIYYTLGIAKTAREAIRKMAELTDRYGYRSSGETFSLMDAEEVWVMDWMSKGPGEKGAVWVARKVPDGMVCSHANQARIQTWNHSDTENNMWAADVVDFAVRKGLYQGKPEDFSFSDVFDPVTFSGARLGEVRVWSFYSKVSDDASFGARYLDYAQGYNLTNRMPLFIRPRGPISVNDTMWHMRSHYDGTWFDSSSDVGAGPFHARLRARPSSWEYDGAQYVNERTIATQQTGWNFVAQSRAATHPKEIAAVIWFAVDDTSTGPHFPAYAASRGVPHTWAEGNGSGTDFVLRSAHWIYNMVANLAYAMWEPVFPWVQAKVADVERAMHAKLAACDAKATALLRAGDAAGAQRAVTEFTKETGDALVDEWVRFYGETFARFHDYSVISKGEPKHPADKPVPHVEQPGFDDAWKARIVKETGDKYRVPRGLAEADLAKLRAINKKL